MYASPAKLQLSVTYVVMSITLSPQIVYDIQDLFQTLLILITYAYQFATI